MKTLNDIAKSTGFSVSTVSRVLNGKADSHRISKSTRDAILKVVEQEGYRPYAVAQSLRNKLSCTIGLVVPYIQNHYFASVASAVVREARKFDHNVIVIDSVDDPDREQEAIDSLLTRRIDGILIVPAGESPDRIKEISRDLPVVLMDRYFPGSDLPYVACDNYLGAMEATTHLLLAGHRNILCIQGSERSITSKERVRGYREALKKFGCADLQQVRGNAFTINNGYVETKMALSLPQPPTALFALSNTILLGALKAIKESGLNIPDDISIVSFDDNMYLDYMSPAITRVAQPLEAMCTFAVKMLMDKIRDPQAVSPSNHLAPTLLHRASVALSKQTLLGK